MKTVLLYLILRTLAAPSATDGPRHHSGFADREVAEPAANPELVQLARQRTAYLADMLHLSPAQARRLYRPTYEQLRELRWLDPDAPASAETDVTTAYHQRLMRVLSPGQYSAWLQLEGRQAELMPVATTRR